MPTFDDMDSYSAGGIVFTGQTLGSVLGGTQYTQVHWVVDTSLSVEPFAANIEAVFKRLVRVLRLHPRADDLVARLTTFSHDVREFHGWRMLPAIAEADYDGLVSPRGWTALHAAVDNAVTATVEHGRMLVRNDVETNALIVVLTDGDNNRPGPAPADIRAKIEGVRHGEAFESLETVLIGVNVSNPAMAAKLDAFRRDAGLDHYLNLDTADDSALAAACGFIVRSVYATNLTLADGSRRRGARRAGQGASAG